MSRRKSSLKKMRVDKKRHTHNLKVKQDLKKTIKKFLALLAAKNVNEAKAFLKTVYSQLDKAAKKKVINSSLASRKKSRLTKQLRKTA